MLHIDKNETNSYTLCILIESVNNLKYAQLNIFARHMYRSEN